MIGCNNLFSFSHTTPSHTHKHIKARHTDICTHHTIVNTCTHPIQTQIYATHIHTMYQPHPKTNPRDTHEYNCFACCCCFLSSLLLVEKDPRHMSGRTTVAPQTSPQKHISSFKSYHLPIYFQTQVLIKNSLMHHTFFSLYSTCI